MNLTKELVDRRADRVAVAAAAARTNMPSHLMVIAMVLFVVSLSAMFWAMAARRAALVEFDARAAQADTIRRLIRDIQQARAEADTRKGQLGNDPLPDISLRIQNAAPDKMKVVLAQRPAPRETTAASDTALKLVRKTYSYQNLPVESITDFFAWVDEASRTVKGLDVDGVSLRPTTNSWTVNITFARWERKEG